MAGREGHDIVNVQVQQVNCMRKIKWWLKITKKVKVTKRVNMVTSEKGKIKCAAKESESGQDDKDDVYHLSADNESHVADKQVVLSAYFRDKGFLFRSWKSAYYMNRI